MQGFTYLLGVYQPPPAPVSSTSTVQQDHPQLCGGKSVHNVGQYGRFQKLRLCARSSR